MALGFACAECGTTDAATYVVTFTNGQDDETGRTEVCRTCDTHLHAPTWHDHTYRRDVSAWWCPTCDTVTDYCTQESPR